ncbi:hypothetical protein Belba_2862 [Belliella baltica DSM 15883]|uniref:Uncharacterized protein n=1 Tax=Belliella baltica (strain DSM 15883 / CIP 108006 / LMG 21964 / BA134) TaxID=866536 RepID=I3Z826_BELBD|nr:hypothetical protein [Belliella baltica]AFL85394.1 hypothetical protein Belba_2862 [Belliella baltica DSM 15883]
MGFFKNVFTLGKYGKLENEIKELQKLVEIYEKASPDFTQIIKLQNRVTDLLQEQRKIASKNLYLAKTIVLKVKKRVGDNQKNVLIDEHFLIKAPKVKSKKNIYNTELNSSFDDVGTDFFDLINTSANMLEKKNGNINEKDLIAHGVMIGVGALLSGFEALVDLNDEVREKRQAVQNKKLK